MGWYTRGELSLGGFRCLASWDSPQNPVFQSFLRILRSGYSNSGSKEATLNGFPSFSSVSHRLGTRDLEVKKTFRNPFFSVGARRFHHLDPHNVKHFRPRGWRRWFQNPTHVFIVVMVGSGVLISLYFGNLETIPYTKRTHWIMISKDLERWLGERVFERTKAGLEGKILPPTHPDTVRVKKKPKKCGEGSNPCSNEHRQEPKLGGEEKLFGSMKVEKGTVAIGGSVYGFLLRRRIDAVGVGGGVAN